MLQDRNTHRDAQLLRKATTVPLIVPAFGVNQDEPIFGVIPRYNFRLTDLHTFVNNLATAVLTVGAQVVEPSAVAGNPRLISGAAVTFAVDEFWRRNGTGTGFTNIAADPVTAFTVPDGIATVLDGFWGVWLVAVDDSNTVGTIAAAPTMAFATEEDAIAACPTPRPFTGSNGAVGRVGILTVNSVGGDFIAGTTFTNVNTPTFHRRAGDQEGHICSIPIGSSPHTTNADRQTRLKDPSQTRILTGRADVDMVVVTTKCFGGASVLTGPAQAVVEYRPFAGGEGRGDASVSQTPATFVP